MDSINWIKISSSHEDYIKIVAELFLEENVQKKFQTQALPNWADYIVKEVGKLFPLLSVSPKEINNVILSKTSNTTVNGISRAQEAIIAALEKQAHAEYFNNIVLGFNELMTNYKQYLSELPVNNKFTDNEAATGFLKELSDICSEINFDNKFYEASAVAEKALDKIYLAYDKHRTWFCGTADVDKQLRKIAESYPELDIKLPIPAINAIFKPEDYDKLTGPLLEIKYCISNYSNVETMVILAYSYQTEWLSEDSTIAPFLRYEFQCFQKMVNDLLTDLPETTRTILTGILTKMNTSSPHSSSTTVSDEHQTSGNNAMSPLFSLTTLSLLANSNLFKYIPTDSSTTLFASPSIRKAVSIINKLIDGSYVFLDSMAKVTDRKTARTFWKAFLDYYDITQKEIADILGTTPSSITKDIQANKGFMLSRALNTSYDFACGYVSLPRYGRFAYSGKNTTDWDREPSHCEQEIIDLIKKQPFAFPLALQTPDKAGLLEALAKALKLKIDYGYDEDKNEEYREKMNMIAGDALNVAEGMLALLNKPEQNRELIKIYSLMTDQIKMITQNYKQYKSNINNLTEQNKKMNEQNIKLEDENKELKKVIENIKKGSADNSADQ